MRKLIHLIAAARPNFMKIAPLYHALLREDWVEPIIVHTGQHYDLNMSDSFFKDFELPKPHFNLGIGSGTHAEQTGRVMITYEKIIYQERPDLVIVVGDVNATLAAALASVKIGIKVAHLEAGLRSFDRTMPEEINRVVTDSISDLLWTPSIDGDRNLLREGITQEKIERVGNIMIDSLEMLRYRIEKENICHKLGLSPGKYGLITLHRPANVDFPEPLEVLCKSLVRIAGEIPLVFPVHPRTSKKLKDFGFMHLLKSASGLNIIEPLSYIPFMNLAFNSKFVITDSGGLQEETTYLNIPCLTLRPNTERPITIEQGTNRLCKIADIETQVDVILNNKNKDGKTPELWDGHTADRVVSSISIFLSE